MIAWRGGTVRSKVQKPFQIRPAGEKGDFLQIARLYGLQAMRCQVGGNGELEMGALWYASPKRRDGRWKRGEPWQWDYLVRQASEHRGAAGQPNQLPLGL